MSEQSTSSRRGDDAPCAGVIAVIAVTIVIIVLGIIMLWPGDRTPNVPLCPRVRRIVYDDDDDDDEPPVRERYEAEVKKARYRPPW